MVKVNFLIQEILAYRNLFAPEQLSKFRKIYESVSAPEVAKHYPLLLIMFTKPNIFVGTGKFNNKANKNIKELTATFKKVIKTLNKVKFDEIENFVERIGNTERRVLNDYIEDVAETILNYKDSQAMLLGDDLLAIKLSVNIYMNSLSNNLNLIETIYLSYKKEPHKDSSGAVLEDKRLAFKRRAFKYREEMRKCLLLSLAVVTCLIFWGILLVINPFKFYNHYMATINYYILIGSILGKIIITTTLFLILSACLRFYYALKHNETICQHRADVLSCYEALYSTEEEKKFVLTKVTEAVFTQLPTGLSKQQSDEGKSNISLESLVSLLTRRGSSLD